MYMSLQHKRVDIMVIGGGITGAGVAWDAVNRGYNVALVEKHDFGFGASTATSKLAHGGLRYLKQWQFSLVKESINERNFLLRQAPHIVKPLRILLPFYSNNRFEKVLVKIGLSMYDWFQNNQRLPNHSWLNNRQLIHDVPWLNTDRLRGSALFYDAQMDDHRILMELLIMAQKKGVFIQNYSSVDFVQPKHGAAISVISGEYTGTIYAKQVVSAVGAWSNQLSTMPLVKPTKGVHIVVPNLNLTVGLLLQHPLDGRVFFILPWYGLTLIGTTDTISDDAMDTPLASTADIAYLLDGFNAYSTNHMWSTTDVIDAFCGYRPLIHVNEHSPSKQSRDDALTWLNDHMVAITGGKYTTYRKMAERCLNAIEDRHFKQAKPAGTDRMPFIGAEGTPPSKWRIQQLCNRYGISNSSMVHLIQTYGQRYVSILATIDDSPLLAHRFDAAFPIIQAELYYCIKNEWVKSLNDFLYRRTNYGIRFKQYPKLLTAIAGVFKKMTKTDVSVDELIALTHRTY